MGMIPQKKQAQNTLETANKHQEQPLKNDPKRLYIWM
jgi:hypothetical protein